MSTDTVKARDRMRSELLVLKNRPSRENIITLRRYVVLCRTIPRTSLLNITPVTVSMILEPKTRFTVEVMDTAIPLPSTIEVWLCTELPWDEMERSDHTHCPMVLRNVEKRLVICCRVGIILLPDIEQLQANKCVSTYVGQILRY